MRVLILGGGIFIGRHFLESALAKGHEVSVFSRFKSQANFPPGVEKIRGDRYTDLSGLKNRQWDVVVDTSGYLPSAVRKSAEILAGSIQRYLYISSVSVYKNLDTSYIDENSRLQDIDDEAVTAAESIDKSESPTALSFGESYGGLKARCEDIVENIFPRQSLIIRAGLVVGPYDYTNRFVYWPKKFQRGREFLLPKNDLSPICFIDARDVADWAITMLEDGQSGIFNATGMQHDLSFEKLIDECKAICGNKVVAIRINEEFISNSDIKLWEELPLLLPKAARGFALIDDKKAVENGLRYRPLKATISDALSWSNVHSPKYKITVGMGESREQELINEWKVLSNK